MSDEVETYLHQTIEKVVDDFQQTINSNRDELRKAASAIAADGWNLTWMDHVTTILLNNAELSKRTISRSMTAMRQIDE